MSETGANPSLPVVPGSRRGKPGRPKKGDPGIFHTPENGHNVGTGHTKPRMNTGAIPGPLVLQAIAPRLLDLPAAAAYLCVSPWTVRDLEAAGILARVRIPLPNAGEVRKLLFDRAELDRLIDVWKEAR